MNALSQTTRVRGFAEWRPQKRSLILLDQICHVLDEYEDYLPLTIRQVFYRLVATHEYDKTELAYNRLCETMNRARRAQIIPFSAIREDKTKRIAASCWEGVDEVLSVVSGIADGYRLDRQQGQSIRLLVMCEAGGMAPMLANAVNDLGVPVMSSGGFDSVTAKYELAKESAQYAAAEILHIGDHDPSGVHLFSALAEDIREFSYGLEPDACVSFARLAVTPEQINELDLPSAPPKKTDRRAFSGEAVQAEAIPPDILTSIVRQAVIDRQDQAVRAGVLGQEEHDREQLRMLIGGDQ